VFLGVNTERRSLEDIAQPLTAAYQQIRGHQPDEYKERREHQRPVIVAAGG